MRLSEIDFVLQPSGKYRYGYQGQYAERDEETGWNHFELREYDPVVGRWTSVDPAGQFYSPYVGMGNDPVSGFDPNGAWVPGAGLWNNLFKSDQRIWSERRADEWGGSILSQAGGGVSYSAGKNSDGTWGVWGSQNNPADRSVTVSFTPVDAYGNLGERWESIARWSPAPGNIDFDAGTQLALGFAARGAITIPSTSARVATSLYWNTGAMYNAGNIVVTQAARNLSFNLATRLRGTLLGPAFGSAAWKVGSKTYIEMIHFSRKGNVDLYKTGKKLYDAYDNVGDLIE
ncbi:hypothetical protein DQQ10_23735 [Pseudochryseolinea flava]|uniref:RHS repeat-associated core domain-containing protein n=2 Tax=Pseudochryseolinea flava TaxID=2059302 RepID=A0A364XWH2_9BACT|nr:hypothetical protein DQQ10_23735 [Pseudochryseolinea flava]